MIKIRINRGISFSKNMISKGLVSMIKALHRLDKTLTQNAYNSESHIYADLTPSINADEDKAYTNVMRWALRNVNIKNVALTGPYGSGKSSILKSFEEGNKEFTYLNISLASFKDEIIEDNSERQLIELSILQQIFYRVKSSSLPDSRFKRIRKLSGRKLLAKSVLLVLWFAAVLFVFKPGFFSKVSGWRAYLDQNEEVVLYCALIIFLIGIVFLLTLAFRIFNSVRFNKINLKSGEIEVSPDNDTSILNKHLDEILYFFEATKYDVVIIEDLDRFQDPEIFTKLRELNFLINNSKQVSRRVVFIYAIKDDMFLDKKSRTKFFDFIIPVIPVINSSNSGEVLVKKLHKAKLLQNISAEFISDVTLFIDDMRMLVNIVNEFDIYKRKIGIALNEDKLMGMIIYKNIYPTDFADLHSDAGMIYNIFNNKGTQIKRLISEIEEVKLEIVKRIEEIENEQLKNVEELRMVYLSALIERIPQAQNIIIKNYGYSFKEAKEDECFSELINQGDIIYSNGYSNSRSGISFAKIDNYVDTNKTYKERERDLKLKGENEIEKLKLKLEKHEIEIRSIRSWSLREIIQKDSLEAIDEKISKEKLLAYLIRHGYIDEMYHSYISYFYEGSVTREDMDFVMSVKNQEPLDFTFKLAKVDGIVKKLRVNEFKREEVLNHNLVDYLIEKKEIYPRQSEALIFQISNKSEKPISFFNSYLEVGKEKEKFIQLLCKKWGGFWEYVELESKLSIAKKDEILKLIIHAADIEDIENLNRNGALGIYISRKPGFLTWPYENNLGPEEKVILKIKEILLKLSVHFESLSTKSNVSEVLFNFIYENDLYAINEGMIEIMLEYKGNHNGPFIENLKKSNFTTIKESKCDKLLSYVEENINHYLSNVFLKLENNIFESEEVIIFLLNNKNVLEVLKERIIIKERTLIKDIAQLDNNLWGYLIGASKVAARWDNLLPYYEQVAEIDAVLLKFLNTIENHQELSTIKLDAEDEEEGELHKKLSEEIILESGISDLTFQYLIKSIPNSYDSLDFRGLSNKKIGLMVNNGILNLTRDNFEFLKSYYSDNHLILVENSIDDFLEIIDEFFLDGNDLQRLLNSKVITKKQKVEIIKSIDQDIVEINGGVSNLIVNILSNYSYTEIEDFNLLLNAVSQCSSTPDKIRLLKEYSPYLNEAELTELLLAIGSPYSEISKKGSNPSILNTEVNRQIANQLLVKEYISSFQEKPKKIKIYTKRK